MKGFKYRSDLISNNEKKAHRDSKNEEFLVEIDKKEYYKNVQYLCSYKGFFTFIGNRKNRRTKKEINKSKIEKGVII